MLTINLTDIPDPAEEKDKFQHFMQVKTDSFRVVSAEEAELLIDTDSDFARRTLYNAIDEFLINQVNAYSVMLRLKVATDGRWILKKYRLEQLRMFEMIPRSF